MRTGEFLCRGLFLQGHRKDCKDDDPAHPGIKVCALDEAGVDTRLTAAGMAAILKLFPSFEQVFRLWPRKDGRYRVTLVPTSIELNSTYSELTAAP